MRKLNDSCFSGPPKSLRALQAATENNQDLKQHFAEVPAALPTELRDATAQAALDSMSSPAAVAQPAGLPPQKAAEEMSQFRKFDDAQMQQALDSEKVV